MCITRIRCISSTAFALCFQSQEIFPCRLVCLVKLHWCLAYQRFQFWIRSSYGEMRNRSCMQTWLELVLWQHDWVTQNLPFLNRLTGQSRSGGRLSIREEEHRVVIHRLCNILKFFFAVSESSTRRYQSHSDDQSDLSFKTLLYVRLQSVWEHLTSTTDGGTWLSPDWILQPSTMSASIVAFCLIEMPQCTFPLESSSIYSNQLLPFFCAR